MRVLLVCFCIFAPMVFGQSADSVSTAASLSDDEWTSDWLEETDTPIEDGYISGLTIGGFAEAGVGDFIQTNSTGRSSLRELRQRIDVSAYVGESFLSAKFELLVDSVDDSGIQLVNRELYIDTKISDAVSMRIGRQVLTWGTGDLVFLNDFFPKNWQSMFSGRDDEYLKSSSTAVKFNYFNNDFDVNLVWQPKLETDEYISGERFSYFNPLVNNIVSSPRVTVKKPRASLSNGQLALRVSTTMDGVEYALYAYRGFYTQPLSYSIDTQENYFSRLNSVGGSMRRGMFGGLVNAEVSYWDSVEDPSGTKQFVPNSQVRYLLGFEKELFSNFTMGLQWFSEQNLDYDAASVSLSSGKKSPKLPAWHHTATLRLTYLTMNQKLTWSLFGFYSPDEKDFYLKPKLSYRHNDRWSFIVGANEFSGSAISQQWGQFEKNSNVYLRARYSF